MKRYHVGIWPQVSGSNPEFPSIQNDFVAQLAEHIPFKDRVERSNRSGITIIVRWSSGRRRLFAKQIGLIVLAGSNPARTAKLF